MKTTRNILSALLLLLLVNPSPPHSQGGASDAPDRTKSAKKRKLIPPPFCCRLPFAADRDVRDCIVLTDGITGGYVPAHVRTRILIYQHGGEFFVRVMRQKTRSSKKSFKSGKLKKAEFRALLALAEKAKWWKFPLESPKNSEDIYKLNSSIGLRIGRRRWLNGAPNYCCHRESKAQASAAQRKLFAPSYKVVKDDGEIT